MHEGTGYQGNTLIGRTGKREETDAAVREKRGQSRGENRPGMCGRKVDKNSRCIE